MATPSRAGCAVVLPTLAACTANPTAAGCSAVLPPVSACVANPTAPGCVVVVPPQGPVQGSINQAINTTVALINTTTTIVRDPGNVSGSQLTAGGSAPAADSKKDTAATNLADKGDNKTAEPAKKTYCN
jgi:hypothetical protein